MNHNDNKYETISKLKQTNSTPKLDTSQISFLPLSKTIPSPAK